MSIYRHTVGKVEENLKKAALTADWQQKPEDKKETEDKEDVNKKSD